MHEFLHNLFLEPFACGIYYMSRRESPDLASVQQITHNCVLDKLFAVITMFVEQGFHQMERASSLITLKVHVPSNSIHLAVH